MARAGDDVVIVHAVKIRDDLNMAEGLKAHKGGGGEAGIIKNDARYAPAPMIILRRSAPAFDDGNRLKSYQSSPPLNNHTDLGLVLERTQHDTIALGEGDQLLQCLGRSIAFDLKDEANIAEPNGDVFGNT